MNKKYIIIGSIIGVLVILIIGLWIYGNSIKNYDESLNQSSLGLYVGEEDNIENIDVQKEDIPRKSAYYDEHGFVSDSLYIDCQIYNELEDDNIKAAIDSRTNEIKTKISEDQSNTSGMIVINVSANTSIREKINVLEYNETYRRYKMLKTYFDSTFSTKIMREDNKIKNTNIFNVDLENNKNISYNDEKNTIFYSIKTGQKLQNAVDLFSADYDFASVIKERIKYMLDINVGYSENEVDRRVNEAYDKIKIEVDLVNEKLKISLDDDGFEMFFDEFDKSKMTIY